jgi:hypothetical protein
MNKPENSPNPNESLEKPEIIEVQEKSPLEKAKDSVLASLRLGVPRSNIDSEMKRGEIPQEFLDSPEAKDAVKKGVVTWLNFRKEGDLETVKKIIEDFPLTAEETQSIADDPDFQKKVNGQIQLGNIENFDGIKSLLGVNFLEKLTLDSNGEAGLQILLLKQDFETIEKLETSGISKQSFEDAFANLFSRAPQVLPGGLESVFMYAEKLGLTDRFYKNLEVQKLATFATLTRAEVGDMDEFLKYKSQFKLDISQEQFEAYALKYYRKIRVARGQEEIEEFKRRVKEAGYNDDFTQETPSSETAVREGFQETMNLDEPRTAIFSQMAPGEFKTLSYPEGDIAEDPSKTGQVHTVLFKSPEGKNMQKILTGKEYENGWTKFAANSLVRALYMAENGPVGLKDMKELDKERDGIAIQNGFRENLSPTPSKKAIFDSLLRGNFLALSYPEGEIANEPGKKGYFHTVIYKSSDGKYLEKSLTGDARKNGWTKFEADAYVKSIEDKNPASLEQYVQE